MGFQVILYKETISSAMVESILKCVPREAQIICRMEDINIASGCGVINAATRCLWDKQGHRITFSKNYESGESMFMRSRIVDPMAYDYTNSNPSLWRMRDGF